MRAHLVAERETGPGRDLWPAVAARLRGRPVVIACRFPGWQRLAAAVGVVAATAVAVTLLAVPRAGPAEEQAAGDVWLADAELTAVWDDPWAGEVTQALDWVLTEASERTTSP